MGDQEIILQKPDWLKIRPPSAKFLELKSLFKEEKLHTVCEESHCPNISECWSKGTATFMILGNTCTRGCKFCHVKTGYPQSPPYINEPARLIKAIKTMKLDYVVITSVDRDDLIDQGAEHFARCITLIKKAFPTLKVEVLIPDFRGNKALIKKIIDAQPHVIAHNVETIERLQGTVRDKRANYEQSLGVLQFVKEINSTIYTKSALMLGLGEKEEEVLQTFRDLKVIDVDAVTLGQYLRPSPWHLAVQEYVTPEHFKHYEQEAKKIGFAFVAAGPFVRSSYRAAELFFKEKITEYPSTT